MGYLLSEMPPITDTVIKKRLDLTGQTFGRLTVIQRANRALDLHWKWRCQCTCGKWSDVGGMSLKRGITKSCGCLRSELTGERRKAIKRIPDAEIIRRKLHYQMAGSAKARGLAFALSTQDVWELTRKNCTYCKRPPSNTNTIHHRKLSVKYTGIDRIDNKQGYILNNCTPCCRQCNRAKNTMSVEEFREWIDAVHGVFHEQA